MSNYHHVSSLWACMTCTYKMGMHGFSKHKMLQAWQSREPHRASQQRCAPLMPCILLLQTHLYCEKAGQPCISTQGRSLTSP